MNRVRTLAQAVFLIAALAFAATTVPPSANAESFGASTWCEENYPGNPECVDDAYRTVGPEGCEDPGCPTWLLICCIEWD